MRAQTEVTVVEDKLDETALAQAAEEESSDETRVSMKSYSVFVRVSNTVYSACFISLTRSSCLHR